MKWNNMSPKQRGETLYNMRKGSPFAQALAALWVLADPYNDDKLAQAFPEIVERYRGPIYDEGL